MGGKSKSAPAPVAAPAPQVQTPDVDVAQTAAMKALAAQGDVRNAQAAEDEQQGKKTGSGLAQASTQQAPQQKRRPARDPASVANAATGGMASSAVLTG